MLLKLTANSVLRPILSEVTANSVLRSTPWFREQRGLARLYLQAHRSRERYGLHLLLILEWPQQEPPPLLLLIVRHR